MPRKQEEQDEVGELGWGLIIKGLAGRGTMAGEFLTTLGCGGVSMWDRCGVYFEKSTMASG